MTKLLIDVDTGVDDSIALLYALNHPDVEIVGITTAFGNTYAENAAVNSLKIIELSGTEQEIPVVVGAHQPLNGEWDGPVTWIHGDNGLGNVDFPEPKRKPITDIPVEDFLYETACKHEGELVLVTLGRLTNIALTLQKHPDFAKKIKRVVMMGGTVNACGNVSPVVEANFWGDPEACDQVFMSGMEIMTVGLDVTTKIRLTMDHVALMEKYCSEKCRPAVNYMKQALEPYIDGGRRQDHFAGYCPLHDPLAMVATVKRDIVKTERRRARIECGGTYCRGMVVTDRRVNPIDAEYIEFALEVDEQRALDELMSVFCTK